MHYLCWVDSSPSQSSYLPLDCFGEKSKTQKGRCNMQSPLMVIQQEGKIIYTFGSFSHTVPDSLSMMTPTDEEVEEDQDVT